MSDDERNRDIAQRFHDIRGWLQAAEGLELMKLAFEYGGNGARRAGRASY